jgi:hypothetical protein
MSDILAWVSFALQVYSTMLPGWPTRVRVQRCLVGEAELDLGFYRRRVVWTERRDTRR